MNSEKYTIKSRGHPSISGMRISLLCSFFFCITILSFSQTSLLETELTLPAQDTTVEAFLRVLGNNAGYTFTHGGEIPLLKKVKIEPKAQSVKAFLDEIFAGDSLKYIEKYKKIIIVPIESKNHTKIQKQTIKGRIVDLDTKVPLVGANVYIASTSPLIGSTTNSQGYFKIENLPVGWYTINVSFIGFKPINIDDILLVSGKEKVVNIRMEELITDLKGVEISSLRDKSKPVNDLALVSSRRISALEMDYYPGSLDDISRAAVSFAGVFSNNDGQNHMIIRGNSPKGLQWRLEGIEVPNLNHFAEIGSSGGGVGIINNNIIGESDFMVSAFPSEYGNALSGVFDLRLRTGNKDRHEQTFQIGMLGIELMLEGPLKRKSNATYIAQYRYSTLKLMESLGVDQKSIPEFQDLSFKIHLPSQKAGVFSIFGIGGLSRELEKNGYDWGSNMTAMGVSHNFYLNSKTWIKSVIAFTGWHYTWQEDENIGTSEMPIDYSYNSDVTEYSGRFSFQINRKINTKHKLKFGLEFDNTLYDTFMGWKSDTLYSWYQNPDNPNHSDQINYQYVYSNDEGNAQTLQIFGNWKYRITKNLVFNSGLHFIQCYLNNSYSIEPRVGLSWNFLSKHNLSAGYGIHSRKESITLYTGQKTLHDGEIIQPNINLELTKSMHYVLGYSYLLNQDLIIKTEAYYQYIYDIPVYPFPPYFSTINFDYGFEGNILVSEGTAYNKGIELTLEKFFSNGYHILINGTVYDSKYKNYLGEEYNTKYNGSYAAKGLFIKEFKVGSQKQNIISIGTRCIYLGGMRYLPIDLEASLANNSEVKIWDDGFTQKANDFFRLDLQISFIRNKAKYTGEWRLDIINVTNQKNMRWQRYNNAIRAIEIEYQNPLIPLLTYRIKF
jgi:hypothetical protein